MGIGSFCYTKRDTRNLVTIQPKSIKITGIQKGFTLKLEIYQSFKTDADLEEVSYVFPTDNKLCIYGMKFQVGDETINAQIRSLKGAQEIFDEAVKENRTVAMTQEKIPGVTSIIIGSVPKDTTVGILINCSFISTLMNPKTILTKIPLQTCDEYGSTTDLYDIPSLEIILQLKISQLDKITTVYTNCESNYQPIDEYNGELTINSALITDENILIMTEFQNPIQSQMIRAGKTALLSIIPQFESKKNDIKEYVFLIDCSASMLGQPIRKARESLHLFLNRLPQSSYFNIIRFGSTYDKLFKESAQNSPSNRKKAHKYIDLIKANLGSSEMYEPLQQIFKSEVKIGHQRQIFTITDGEVYEHLKVLELIEENRGFNRFFSIGLGHGADAGFLEEVAAVTNGKSDFVFDANDLPMKVAEHLSLSQEEAATGARIDVENNESFMVEPFPLPPLLSGVLQHFFIVSDSSIEKVMVTAKLNETEEIELCVSDANEWSEREALFALFASRQMRRIENDEERSIKLSLESGVLSKFTSYVAVSDHVYVERQKEPPECEFSVMSKSSAPRIKRIPKKKGFFEQIGGFFRSHHFGFGSVGAAASPAPASAERISYMASLNSNNSNSNATEKKVTENGDRAKDEEERGGSRASGTVPNKGESRDKDSDMHHKEVNKDREGDNKNEEGENIKNDDDDKEAHKDEDRERNNEDEDGEVNGKENGNKEARKDEDRERNNEDEDGETNGKDNGSEEAHKDEEGENDSDNKEAHKDEDRERKTKGEDLAGGWPSDASLDDILRMQSRDGFWDLPSLFVTRKTGGCLSDVCAMFGASPIVMKRAASTLFALCYLARHMEGVEARWRFAREKGLRWLRRVGPTVEWEDVIREKMQLILE